MAEVILPISVHSTKKPWSLLKDALEGDSLHVGNPPWYDATLRKILHDRSIPLLLANDMPGESRFKDGRLTDSDGHEILVPPTRPPRMTRTWIAIGLAEVEFWFGMRHD